MFVCVKGRIVVIIASARFIIILYEYNYGNCVQMKLRDLTFKLTSLRCEDRDLLGGNAMSKLFLPVNCIFDVNFENTLEKT